MHAHPNRIHAAIAVLCVLGGLVCRASATQINIPDPPEPSSAELFDALGVDSDDPQAVFQAALTLALEQPESLDVWLPDLRTREHRAVARKFSAEWERRRQEEPGKWDELPPGGILEPLVAQLVTDRPQTPARQLDALLRRLGEIGGPAETPLTLAQFTDTPWGQWKAYYPTQQIMARTDPATCLDQMGVRGGPEMQTLALLAGDLKPAQAAAWAREIHARLAEPRPGSLTQPLGVTGIWLGWALAGDDPEASAALFRDLLESHDPAVRLAAGQGLMALGQSVPPFRLTAPLKETVEARTQWLATLEPQALDPYWQPKPLDLPVVKHQRGGRVDLVWLDQAGEPVRRVDDVWPSVRQVLPDGTFWSAQRHISWTAYGLTGPSGEIYSRVSPPDWGDLKPLHHGGALVSGPNSKSSTLEFPPWGGAPLWGLPISRVRSGTGVRGQFFSSDGQHLINRRGDIVRDVLMHADATLGDRYVEFVDPQTLLAANPKSIVLKQANEPTQRFDGFISITDIRFNADGFWLILDASRKLVLLDPTTGKRVEYLLGSSNDDIPVYSRWVNPGEQGPK